MPEFFLENAWLTILTGALLTGLLFGLIAASTRYCNMGAVADWVNTGDLGRMRAWMLSIAVVALGVVVLEYMTWAGFDDTRANYRMPLFPWVRYLLGGLIFGVGMVLAGGCTTRTLVNIGNGNIKALYVFIVVGLTALLLLNWPVSRHFIDVTLAWPSLDLNRWQMPHQDIGTIIHGLTGGIASTAVFRLLVGIAAVALLLWGTFRLQGKLRKSDLIGGIGIGLTILLGWIITATLFGQTLMTEASFAFETPRGLGAQSLTFVGPAAETLRLLDETPRMSIVTFGIAALLGVVLGALLWFLIRKQFKLQAFRSKADFVRYTIGAVLMGAGGVIAMGCSIGQGLTGISTLAIGSIIATLSMIAGAFMTSKAMFYRIIYPESGWKKTGLAITADLRLCPLHWHPFPDEIPSNKRPDRCS